MKRKHWIIVFFILLSAVILCGCRVFFRPYDQVKKAPQAEKALAHIKQIDQPGIGNLKDITNDGKNMLVFAVSETLPTTYTIELFEAENGTWSAINFLSSEKTLYDGCFSRDHQGIYYTETMTKAKSASRALIWTPLDRSSTKVLTETDEKVVTDLFPMTNGTVLYGNDQNQIVEMGVDNVVHRWQIEEKTALKSAIYNASAKQIIFSTENKNDLEDLFRIDPQSDHPTPIKIVSDILDYDINPVNGDLYCLRHYGSEIRLSSVTLPYGSLKDLKTGSYDQIACLPDGSGLILTENTDALTVQAPSRLLYLDVSGRTPIVIASPQVIVGDFFLTKNSLFFNTENGQNPQITVVNWEKQ